MRTSIKARGGFTLMEVMAAVMLIAIALTVMLDLREQAVARAANGHRLAVAARLGSQLLHRIEAGMELDVIDGTQGDFAEEGYDDFLYIVALGDGSSYAENDEIDTDSPEWAWRDSLRKREDDRIEEDGDDQRPEKTRVVIRISYPGFDLEMREYRLEAMIDSWAVYRDFELYEDLWGSNNEEADIIQ